MKIPVSSVKNGRFAHLSPRGAWAFLFLGGALGVFLACASSADIGAHRGQSPNALTAALRDSLDRDFLLARSDAPGEMENLKLFHQLDYGHPGFVPSAENHFSAALEIIIDDWEVGPEQRERNQMFSEYGHLCYLVESGQLDLAKEQFGKVSLPRPEWPPLLSLKEIQLYYRAREYGRARDLCENLIESHPDMVETYLLLKEIEQRTRHPEAVIEVLIRAREVAPRHQEVLESLGRRYRLQLTGASNGRPLSDLLDKIEDVYGDLVATSPGRSTSHYLPLLAMIKKEKGKFQEAHDYMETLVRLQPRSSEYRKDLIELKSKLGKKEEMVECVRQGVILTPNDPVIQREVEKLFNFASVKAKNRAVLGFHKPIAEEYPGRADIQLRYARLLIANSQIENAIKVFKASLQHHPRSTETWRDLADTHAQRGELKEAREAYRKFVDFSPPNARTLFDAARVMLGFGDFDSSREYIGKLREIQPNHAGIDEVEARLFVAMEDYEKALAPLRRAIDRNPENWSLQLILADCYLKTEQKDKLGELVMQIAEDFKQDPDVVYQIALFKWELDSFQEAEDLLRRAIDLDREDAEPYNTLAYLLCEQDETRLNDALSLVQKAIELKPGQYHILDTLGWVYFKKGDYPKAIEALEQAVGLGSAAKDPVIQEHLAFSYLKAGRKTEALDHFRTAVKLIGQDKSAYKQTENHKKMATLQFEIEALEK